MSGWGNVSTLAGGHAGLQNGKGVLASFRNPIALAVDSLGRVYVSDYGNNRIRLIDRDGSVSVLAGAGLDGDLRGSRRDGPSDVAMFKRPQGIAVDARGWVYVADPGNHLVRAIQPDGVVVTIAGSEAGFADGPARTARFLQPTSVAVDHLGQVYVTDWLNHRIRRISPDGVVTTVAGSVPGFADGPGSEALFNEPHGVAVDPSGQVYVADWLNNRIRVISLAGEVSTLAGSQVGYADGDATVARLTGPTSVAVDAQSRCYVTEALGHRVRVVETDGCVTTVAGLHGAGFRDGRCLEAMFDYPTGIAAGPDGRLYLADYRNHAIRVIAPESYQ